MPKPTWPAEQEDELRRLLALNVPVKEIAMRLGRTVNAVYCKRQTLKQYSGEERIARMMWLTERITFLRQWESRAA